MLGLGAWNLIKESKHAEDFEQYASAFPNSELAVAARLRAAQLKRDTTPEPLPSAPPTNPGGSALRHDDSGQHTAGEVWRNPTDRLAYVWIPSGRFEMGCSPGDSECEGDEKPAHEVTISRGFWMGQTPVTQEAYQRVTGSNPSHFKGETLPVDSVTWGESKRYCELVGGRLPTEAEWEHGARAGSAESRYGSLDAIGWYSSNSGGTTHPVGQKQANAWGLYDMLGDVWQWTADWYVSYSAGEERDPAGPQSGERRVLRGGSWGGNPTVVRVSYHYVYEPTIRNNVIGFRCVREIP